MRSVPRLALALLCALIGITWFFSSATISAQPPATPLPTLGPPPLTLRGAVSATQVEPGQIFSYAVEVASSSPTQRRVELRIALDARLELVGSGPCSGGATVVCKLSVARDRPASVSIGLRVRGDTPRDSAVALQALAQDDLLSTAASDRATIGVAARQVGTAPTSGPLPARPTLGPIAPSAGAVSSAARPAAAQRSGAGGGNAAAAEGAPPSVPEPASAAEPPPALEPASAAEPAVPGGGAEPAVVVLAAGDLAGEPALPGGEAAIALPVGELAADPAPAVAPGDIAPPPSAPAPEPQAAVPAGPPSAPAARWRGVPLPDTALLPRSLAGLVGLLGLALIIHGVRGARLAATQIGFQARGLRRLAALGAALRVARGRNLAD